MNAMKSQTALDQYFLEARCKLLDLAAILDRIHRGGSRLEDTRLSHIQKAISVLSDDQPAKAERIQMLFSLPYDGQWPVPQPK